MHIYHLHPPSTSPHLPGILCWLLPAVRAVLWIRVGALCIQVALAHTALANQRPHLAPVLCALHPGLQERMGIQRGSTWRPQSLDRSKQPRYCARPDIRMRIHADADLDTICMRKPRNNAEGWPHFIAMARGCLSTARARARNAQASRMHSPTLGLRC